MLLSLLLGVQVAATEPARDAEDDGGFERGWSAYEQGDYAGALDAWLPLAEAENLNAQINVGLLYSLGLGVERDVDSAVRWYESAAVRDSELAQYNLGMLLVGEIESRYEEGVAWLERAAKQGLPQAQYELGALLCEGRRGSADPARGVEWIYRAGLAYLGRGNDDDAREALAAIRQAQPDDARAKQLERRIASFTLEVDPFEESGTSVSVGTGWVLPGGYAVTNLHVVDGNTELTLETATGDTLRASIALSDPENDLVLLRVDEPGRLPAALPLAGGVARLGASVFTIGFPRIDVMGSSPKLTDGIISGVKGIRDDPSTYQISVPIQPGNSGGPLLDMEGRVVGVVASMLGAIIDSSGQAQPLPNVNYAIKASVLEDILSLMPPQDPSPNVLASGHTSLEELAARVQGSILIVRAR
jgi:S1-C subfamily serine protease